MQTGTDQLLAIVTLWFSKSQNDRPLVRRNGKNAGAKENDHQAEHDPSDNDETALQRLGQRSRTGIVNRRGWRGGGFVLVPGVIVVVVRFAHFFFFVAAPRESADTVSGQNHRRPHAAWL